MLSVVCWKWKPNRGYRSTFSPETVNTLARMVARHYRAPHKFVCITDDPTGIDPGVHVIPLWSDHAKLNSPHGLTNPSCYRRLKAFSLEAGELIGARFVSLDLDCVIVGDLAPIWDRPEEFVIWGDTNPTTPYNGSMFMLTAGARRQVWERFDPIYSPRRGRQLGYWGSDQAWIAACLGPNEKRWTKADGVLSYRNEIIPAGGVLPPGARVIFFHGRHDPWHADIRRRHKWVEEHYR